MIGIYCITNNRNGKKYVGQSVDVSRRIHQHFSQLRKGEHPNEAMQKDFNTDGHFFQVTYLELNVPQNMLGAREKY
jgi:group I intron endonuclease